MIVQLQNLTKIFLLLIFAFLGLNLTAQITYVDINASGNNDGSNWDNAYNDLTQALVSTLSGEIWVASGTYHPGGSNPDSLSAFIVFGDPALYGGFEGIETSIDQRDITANPTILSGDLNNDDLPNNFDSFKDDNTLHVIVVDTLEFTDQIVIDGFTIKGGDTTDDGDLDEYFWRGGGLFSYAPVQVSNCTFEGNFARSGSGCFIAAGASGSSFENCEFSSNMSSAQGAGIYMNGLVNIDILNCDFVGNATTRGALYPSGCVNVLVDNCLFHQNSAVSLDGFGGAFFNWQSTGVTLSNCDFTENVAGNGAAIYNDNRDILDLDPTALIIDNCNFEENGAVNWGGGAIYNWRTSYTVMNSNFFNNVAANSAGSIYNGGDDKNIVFNNNNYSNNSATFGAGITCYGFNSIYTISDCEFTGNEASTSGGACIVGFLANATFNDCLFQNNNANFGGGLYVQNDSTEVYFNGGSFTGNTAENTGGGIIISGSVPSIIDGVIFETNSANIAGAIGYNDNDDDASFIVKNCFFNFNSADTQGAGLNLNDVDAEVISCAFVNNICAGDGYGAAISNNVSNETATVNITNSTFADNLASLAVIGNWADTAVSTMVLQNNIFDNTSFNYVIEAGDPMVVSNGGNLCSDDSMLDILTDASDIHDLDPMFIDPDDFDYHLQEGSPCVGNGIEANAPLTDLEGTARFQTIDIGAYESPFMDPLGVEILTIENNGILQLSPNPTRAIGNIRFENKYIGEVNFKIIASDGRTIKSWKANKDNAIYQELITCDDLSLGHYQLVARFKEKVVQTALIIL